MKILFINNFRAPDYLNDCLFHGLNNIEKLKAIKDGLVFLKKEFKVEGMGPIVLKNTLYRMLHGKYDINV